MDVDLIEGEGKVLPFGECGIERLRLEKFLGEGGFGRVWKASDPETGDTYCFKLIKATYLEDEDKIEELEIRVRNEASVRISSPHIVDALGFRKYSPRKYGVLFRLFENANTLGDWMDEHEHTAWERRKDLLQQALKGLAAAHMKNIVHRDVKPDNVLVNQSEEVKIMDFGIGKFKHGTEGATKGPTKEGAQMGTIPYMAPELWIDASRADSRCDIYGFGHVLYEVATGKNAWVENSWNFRDFVRHVQSHTHLIDLDTFTFHEEPGLHSVLKRSLAFDRDSRYESGEEMLTDWLGESEADDIMEPEAASGDFDRAYFKVAEGPTEGVEIPLSLSDGEKHLLKRSQIDRENRYLSRRHAWIQRKRGRFLFWDKDSTNGSFFHGRELSSDEKIELSHGDRVRLADTFLQFLLE